MANPIIGTVGGALGLLTARHAAGSLTLGGIDLLAGLASQSILGFCYTDNTSDQADDLTIEIADPQRTWMQTYLPKKGVECSAQIKVYNWSVTGDMRTIDCGTFWLDQIDFGGPPNVVNVSAVSIPVTTGIKNQKKWRSWEGTDLMSICGQIASESGLTLVWDTPQMPKHERVDQVGSPDLEFLRDKVKEASLCLKIFNKQLIVYSEEEYEARPAAYVITYGMSNIVSYAFSSKLDDTYKDAKVSYVSNKTGELLEGNFPAPLPPEGSEATDDSNEIVEDEADSGEDDSIEEFRIEPRIDFPGPIDTTGGSSADATKKAKANLREKNKKEKECQMMFVGNPDYLSGLNVELTGFGIFDGKWQISSTCHEISGSGYTTSLTMRACLDGY